MDFLTTVEVIVLGLLPIIGLGKRWYSFRTNTYYRDCYLVSVTNMDNLFIGGP